MFKAARQCLWLEHRLVQGGRKAGSVPQRRCEIHGLSTRPKRRLRHSQQRPPSLALRRCRQMLRGSAQRCRGVKRRTKDGCAGRYNTVGRAAAQALPHAGLLQARQQRSGDGGSRRCASAQRSSGLQVLLALGLD